MMAPNRDREGLASCMRKGWRELISSLVLLLAWERGVVLDAFAREGDRAVRLTVEIAWSATGKPQGDEGDVDLDLSIGRIVDVLSVSGPTPLSRPASRGDGSWSLGNARTGRVRVRIEAPLGGNLIIRSGGQVSQFPIGQVVEGAQRSPPQSPMALDVSVERVPWDSLAVSIVQGEGVVAPGAKVPVKVAFNVLTTEPVEVNLRGSLELRPSRGGDPIWRQSLEQSVISNDPSPTPTSFLVPMPKAEGAYVLEVRASWESPALAEPTTLLGRMLRRGKRGLIGGATVSSVRRSTLIVMADSAAPLPARFEYEAGHNHDQEVDSIDLTRSWGHRPSASGRAPWTSPSRTAWAIPEEALAEPTRRDRLRGWISRNGPEAAHLAPSDATGLSWSALGLKLAHPGRPHRLTLTLVGGNPSALGVGLVGQGGAPRPRLLLDVCVSGPPILPDGRATFSWLVWPDSPDPVLILVNRSASEGNGMGGVQVGSVTLTELTGLPAGPTIQEPAGSASRGFGVALSGPESLDRFGGFGETSPRDPLGSARNLAQYLTYCGVSTAFLPESLADRDRHKALDGQALEDAIGPDRLELVSKVLGRQGLSTWLDLSLSGPLPGLPVPGSPEALAKGLVRLDRKGKADGPTYHLLNPEVQAAIKNRVLEVVAKHKAHGKLAGVHLRLGDGPTLLGAPDTGLDDATFGRFAREAFDGETAKNLPGLEGGHDDPERFAARSRFVQGSGRVPWLTWRSEQVAAFYGSLVESIRQVMPSLALAVSTPVLGDGPSGSEARRADLAGLDPSLAWRAVGLDLDVWPTGNKAPIVLRGVTQGRDDLATDLATSPALDAKVAARPSRGWFLDLDPIEPITARPKGATALFLTAQPIDLGPFGDEPLTHALAALDPREMIVASATLAGREERIRRFSQVYRSLPAKAEPMERSTQAFGVAVRSIRSDGQTYLSLSNDTPYPIRVETVVADAPAATVFDLSRASSLKPDSDDAGRHLVLDLLPFGATAIRIGAPEAKVGAVMPYPSEAVITEMQHRYEDLSTKLAWLSRTSGNDKDAEAARTGPTNTGFEPGTNRVVRISVTPPIPPIPAPEPVVPSGWQLAGGMAATLSLDTIEPHSGRGCLRLDAPAPPAAVASDDFTPDASSPVVIRAWLRSDRSDAKVRIWLEGTTAGTPFLRYSEFLVPQTWQERAVRVSDIPPTGLDGARIRFEALTSGSLWIDDLNVANETLSEPERRNARNALLAALQAYKEKRYADFARLAASRWTRHPGVIAGANAELTRRGDTSALPQGSRVR